MAVSKNSATENNNEEEKSKEFPSSPPKRTKDPGVRIVGGRIYDSEHGKTCHQCRQKTMDFVASCKKLKKDKPCTIKFCHKCLINRYGEKAEEVEKLEDWICPKCRGVCNCSFCMKKKGYRPTGILVHTAKATGFNSVLELLHHKGSEVLDSENVVKDSSISPNSSPLSNKGSVASKRNRDKENHCVEQKDAEPKEEGLHAEKERKKGLKKLKRESGTENALDCSGSDERQVPVAVSGSNVEARSSKACKPKKHGNDKGFGLNEGDVNEQEVEKGLSSVEENCGNAEVKSSKSLCKPRKRSNENAIDCGDSDANQDKENIGNAKAKPLLKVCKSRKLGIKNLIEFHKEDLVLPQGTPLTAVAGIELPAEDVGPALQFLEFCNAFSKVLDIKKGQPEGVLRELVRGCVGRRGLHSLVVQFHVKLLSLIEKDMGEESLSYSSKSGSSWLEVLQKCINESQCVLGELPSDFFNRGSSGYDNLDPSKKLRVLNFLCDETLSTEELRNWIDEENTKFEEEKKENKAKVLAAKRQEKLLKQKLKDDMAKAMLSMRGGAPLSLSEHDNLFSKIRTEADKAHAEMLAPVELLPKKNQRSDAVRTEPVLLEGNGHAYWKLRGHNSNPNIILQDIGNWDLVTPQDKWFIYNEEEEQVVEKHISSLRNPRLTSKRRSEKNPLGDGEGMGHDSPNNSAPNCSTEGGSGNGNLSSDQEMQLVSDV